jgi:ABC-type tungstate transport system permease subunit
MRSLRSAAATLVAAITLLVLAAGPAAADTSSTLTVVGTSDVQDSGLMPLLVTPLFEQAYPQFMLNYVSLGTGAAINYAEAGTASALLVHAASLENQFVAGGYSLEPFGRAIFYGDYVLLGPAGDPAGVLKNAPNDIVTAFEDIAAAGAAGKADFVSRANTSGTAVQEHAIWALAHPSSSLTLCPMSSANGGGDAPSSTGLCGSAPSYPGWYHPTGLTQGPNIEAANSCSGALNSSGSSTPDCYVFTDRGTFDCLSDPACRGTSGAPSNLSIVARNNRASARGGSTELVNSFHAYAINPAKFAGNSSVQINSTAAADFLNFITSPTFQAKLRTFLAGGDGPPFIADAAPAITDDGLPSLVLGGTVISVFGSVTNPVPGTPGLGGQRVTVSEIGTGLQAATPIASGVTAADGSFDVTFTPTSTGAYSVTTGQIEQIENPALNPVFGDILQPTSTAPTTIDVKGVISPSPTLAIPRGVIATGSVTPGAPHVAATVTLLARPAGSHGAFKQVATSKLGAGDGSYALEGALKPGRWSVEVTFADPTQVLPATAAPERITVPSKPQAAIALKFSIAAGKATVTGSVRPGAAGKVELLAMNASAGAGAGLSPVATATARRGRFTLNTTLRRGADWVFGVEFLPKANGAPSYSKLDAVSVT